MSEEKPDRLLIPIEGLSFAEYWSVGRVIFHPGECIEALMLDSASALCQRRSVLAEAHG